MTTTATVVSAKGSSSASTTRWNRFRFSGIEASGNYSSRASMSRTLLTLGAEIATGRPYAERSEREPAWHDRLAEFLIAATVKPAQNRLRNPARLLHRI